MAFEAGQLVECLAEREWVEDDETTIVPGPRYKEIVTVRHYNGAYIWLHEYRDDVCFYTAFREDGTPYFRPLSDTRLAVFRKLLAPPPKQTEDA